MRINRTQPFARWQAIHRISAIPPWMLPIMIWCDETLAALGYGAHHQHRANVLREYLDKDMADKDPIAALFQHLDKNPLKMGPQVVGADMEAGTMLCVADIQDAIHKLEDANVPPWECPHCQHKWYIAVPPNAQIISVNCRACGKTTVFGES